MLRVYRQLAPLPTGQKFTTIGEDGRVCKDEWHRLNLRYLGTVETWDEAKTLCVRPIVQEIAAP